MRILHFRRVFSLISESFIYNPIAAMLDRGLDVRVLAVVRYNESRDALPVDALIRSDPHRISSGSPLRRFLGGYFQGSQPDVYLWPLLRPLLRRKVQQINPQVIHAHFGPDGCLIAEAARDLAIPLVVNFYGYDISRLLRERSRDWRRRYRWLFDQSAAVVGISRHVADKLIALGADPAKVHVVYPGVEIEEFRPRDHTIRRRAEIRCIHVGRLTHKKAPLLLIRSFHLAMKKAAGECRLRLIIVGDGELKSQCEQLISELGLDDAVEMRGAVPHEHINALLGESDIYTQHCITPDDGDMEGLGVSFLEASAAGLPIVATRHNGIPEVVIEGETGLLCDERDVEAMACNIARLARCPQLRHQLGSAGRRRVEQQFTLESFVDRQLALLRSVVNRSDGRSRRRLQPTPAGNVGST